MDMAEPWCDVFKACETDFEGVFRSITYLINIRCFVINVDEFVINIGVSTAIALFYTLVREHQNYAAKQCLFE